MSKALFFIFWDEAGRTTYLHLVKNQNNSINSKQATQKAANIWGIINEMSSIPLAWLTWTKSKQEAMALHNKTPVGQDDWRPTLEACSRVLSRMEHLGEEGTRRCPAPPFALSGQLLSANKEKQLFCTNTLGREPTTLVHAVVSMSCPLGRRLQLSSPITACGRILTGQGWFWQWFFSFIISEESRNNKVIDRW